jgi:hypothetical protein
MDDSGMDMSPSSVNSPADGHQTAEYRGLAMLAIVPNGA